MECYHRHLKEGQQYCEENRIPLNLHSGSEIYYTDDTPRLYREGQVLTLANQPVVLLEFGYQSPFDRLAQAARQMGNEGLKVIFAHIERYAALNDVDAIWELKDHYGVLMQMNARTVYDRIGFRGERWKKKVLKEGLIDMIASDAHNIGSRACDLNDARDRLAKILGSGRADWMCGGLQNELLGL